jgi:hypothetical protein
MKRSFAKKRLVQLAVIAFLVFLAIPVLVLNGQRGPSSPAIESVTGPADPQALLDQYREWKVIYEKGGGDRNIVMGLSWSKGLSEQHTKAYGYAKLDLVAGTVSSEVTGLPEDQGWDLWLIQDNPGESRTVLPEAGDRMIRIGTLKPEGAVARLESDLGAEAFKNFRVDFAIVTEEGKGPDESRLLVGTLSLFHDLYRSAQQGRFGVLPQDDRRQGLLTRVMDKLFPTAEAQSELAAVTDLVAEGRRIFKREEFNGNTRRCETCHREVNNLTIDPAFISTLDPNDPLFVAETNPVLQDLENPPAMRKLGLILENLDGFDKPGVLRGVPHTLALGTSLRSSLTGLTQLGIPPSVASGTPGFAHATGWSGDGSPTSMLGPPGSGVFTLKIGDGTNGTVTHVTTGSLRDFAIGAVRQHFPKTLNRVIGVDFRLPTLHELNALEAFQLSTGRQQDIQLPLSLKNATALQGQNAFINVGCNACHGNAGAIDSVTGFNENFNTGVETLSPGPVLDPTVPRDGGFGAAPCGANGACGNGQFNTTTVVEAADTGPFFHSNLAFAFPTRIESAVEFYRLPAFTQSPAGVFLFGGQPIVSPAQVITIGAFLRVINARDNIIQSVGLETRALSLSQSGAQDLLGLSIEELNDAITVLVNGNLHPIARQRLLEAIQLDQQAAATANQAARNQLILQALCKKQAARSDLENGVFPCIATAEPLP